MRYANPGASPTAGLSMVLLLAAAAESMAQDADRGQNPIEEIVVVGTDPSRYQVNETSSLTGIDLSFLELPRVVEVIPEQILLDQKVTELDEALRNVPGVSFSDGFGGSNNDYLIRGFRRNTIYRNGLRVASNFRVNTANLARVQVIKGPASITYGQVEPGGLVDIITKKPLEEQRLYLEGRTGSYDSSLLLADWSQPVGDRGAFRVNLSTESSDTFRDFFDIDRDAAAVTARFDITPATTLNLDYEYRDEFRSFDRGTITVPTPDGREIVNDLVDVDIETRFGAPFEEIDTEFEFTHVSLEHEFSDAWRGGLAAAYESSLSDDFQARPLAVLVFDEDAPIENGFFTGPAEPEAVFDEPSDRIFLVRRSDGSRERDQEAMYLQGQINGEFGTGTLRHRVAVGVDYREAESSRFFVASPPTNGVPVEAGGTGPLLNVRAPEFGFLPKELTTEGRSPIRAETEEYGVFVNDYIELSDRFSVLVGGRLDVNDPDGDGPADSVDEFSPQMAVNYRPVDDVALFASYSEAFEPNSAFRLEADGSESTSELFDPEDSRQYEVGAKAQLFDGRLNVTSAVYRIEKTNVVTVVDSVPRLVDGQDSQGFELSAFGQPVPGMNVMAGYAYTDAEIGTGSNAGNRPRNVAKHTFNFWTSYEVREGRARGLGAGIGAFHMSDRYGDDANSWELGSYTLVDASIWYNLPTRRFGSNGNLRLQAAVKNLFDEEYFPASGGDLRVSIGTPRMVYGSASLTF